MEIRILCDNFENQKKWDEFIKNHPQSTSDHLWAWRSILKKSFGFSETYYLAAEAHGELQGILPLFKIPRGFRKSAFATIPFGNYGGILSNSDEAANALLEKAKELVHQNHAKYLELRHQNGLEGSGLTVTNTTHVQYRLMLTDSKFILGELPSQTRRKIRVAQKNGVTVTDSNDLEAMYSIYAHTARRQGVPCFPKVYFEEIQKEFKENSKIIFASKNGKKIAYYFTLEHQGTLLVQFAGALLEDCSDYPNQLLFWNTLEESIRRGLKCFDFGRSRKNSGTAIFKQRLGLEEIVSPSQFYLPQTHPLAKAKTAKSKFRWASRAWQHLPLPVTESLGPVVLRYFA